MALVYPSIADYSPVGRLSYKMFVPRIHSYSLLLVTYRIAAEQPELSRSATHPSASSYTMPWLLAGFKNHRNLGRRV